MYSISFELLILCRYLYCVYFIKASDASLDHSKSKVNEMCEKYEIIYKNSFDTEDAYLDSIPVDSLTKYDSILLGLLSLCSCNKLASEILTNAEKEYISLITNETINFDSYKNEFELASLCILHTMASYITTKSKEYIESFGPTDNINFQKLFTNKENIGKIMFYFHMNFIRRYRNLGCKRKILEFYIIILQKIFIRLQTDIKDSYIQNFYYLLIDKLNPRILERYNQFLTRIVINSDTSENEYFHLLKLQFSNQNGSLFLGFLLEFIWIIELTIDSEYSEEIEEFFIENLTLYLQFLGEYRNSIINCSYRNQMISILLLKIRIHKICEGLEIILQKMSIIGQDTSNKFLTELELIEIKYYMGDYTIMDLYSELDKYLITKNSFSTVNQKPYVKDNTNTKEYHRIIETYNSSSPINKSTMNGNINNSGLFENYLADFSEAMNMTSINNCNLYENDGKGFIKRLKDRLRKAFRRKRVKNNNPNFMEMDFSKINKK